MYVVFNSFDKAENVDCKRINSLFGTEIEQLSFCVKTLLKLRENMQNNDLILFFILSCLVLLNHYFKWMQTLAGFRFFAVIQFLNRNSVKNGFDDCIWPSCSWKINLTKLGRKCVTDFFPVVTILSGNKSSTVGKPVYLSFKWCHICK